MRRAILPRFPGPDTNLKLRSTPVPVTGSNGRSRVFSIICVAFYSARSDG